MKKVLIIGAGAMGAAFSFPLLDRNHKVTITEPYNTKLANQILKKKKFHPSLKITLPKKLLIKRFSSQLLFKKWDLTHKSIYNKKEWKDIFKTNSFKGYLGFKYLF